MNFQDLEISDKLLKSLNEIDFKQATDIQAQALPVLLGGEDIIACSETGSGKTGAFLIPLINEIITNPKKQGLVLVPTRELANQVFDFAKALLKNEKNISIACLVGGVDIRKQFKVLQKKHQLFIATPGRLIDHLKRKTIHIHKVEHLVLDEGDRMIDMGFLPQIKQILNHLPKERQTAFFTATLDDKIAQLANQYLRNPKRISVGATSRPVGSIRQKVMQVQAKEKESKLLDELNQRVGSVIIFFKTQRRTDKVYGYLKDYGFDVEQIHGGRSQGQRNKAIKSFKDGKTRILCATDVASRGIDVPQIAHVINMDFPQSHEDYVHRIGRTARNGGEGEALSFVTPEETRAWNRLAKKYELSDIYLPESKSKAEKKRPGRNKKRKNFSRFKKKFKSKR